MTVSDQIYLSTRLTPREVAGRIAKALELELYDDEHGVQVIWREKEGDPWFGGDVDLNGSFIHQPEDHTADQDSVMDGYDIEWDVGSSSRDEALVHRIAREWFDKVAARLPWPALLVEDLQRLTAASRPGEGVVEFPQSTSPDAPSREVWRPYALPR